MTLETQLLDFTTSDKETLHGLLFSPRERKSDLALLLVHGVAMNFYLPPLPSFAQALAQQGYHSSSSTRAVTTGSIAPAVISLISAERLTKSSRTAQKTTTERWNVSAVWATHASSSSATVSAASNRFSIKAPAGARISLGLSPALVPSNFIPREPWSNRSSPN